MQILIVDDDMATVDVIRYTLPWNRLGIEKVYTAYNIRTAKKILKDNEVDIIISDIEMPQGSGLDLLAWFREEGLAGEFLLLTCHESFDYATNAVKLHAAEYLLKPFDMAVMEVALKKIILKLQETRQLKENSELGEWAKKSRRQLQIAFWNKVLTGLVKTEQELKEEIIGSNLEIDREADYGMVVSRVTDVQKDKEKFSPGLLLFIMENIHSEKLCGNPENHSVIFHDYPDHYILVTVCQSDTAWGLEERCKELMGEFKEIFTAVITCCIGKPGKIWELSDRFRRVLKLIETNVIYYGGYFKEEQGITEQSVTDYIRYINSLLERVFHYEEEVRQSYTLADKVNQYIKAHYRENIGRNEIAAYLYLAPEYLAKIYKKQTGKGLKEYISEYRIEQAKLLLEVGERIGDVAEKVGFESFTYFSTMFKKYTGISPNQYRRK